MVERFERVGLVRRGRRFVVWYRWRPDRDDFWHAGPRADFERWLDAA